MFPNVFLEILVKVPPAIKAISSVITASATFTLIQTLRDLNANKNNNLRNYFHCPNYLSAIALRSLLVLTPKRRVRTLWQVPAHINNITYNK